MKLFVIAALVAVSGAARLEHLERSYLPPDSSNSLSGGFGQGSNNIGSGPFGASSRGSPNGFGGSANGHASSGFNNGFSSSSSLNGFGNGQGSNGAVDGLKQYLPPHQASGSNGFSGSAKAGCSSCGFARSQQSFAPQPPSTLYGQPQLASSQYNQPQFGRTSPSSQFGAGAPSSQFGAGAPSSLYGEPQFAPSSQYNQAQTGAASGPSFGANGGFGAGSHFAQEQPAPLNRQYLAPKTQGFPQQPFDEQTGYQY